MLQTANTVSSRRKLAQVIALALMVSLIFTMAVTFADDKTDKIAGGIFDGLENVYGILTKIALPIAAICLVFCAFQVWVGGEKGMEKAKKYAIYTLVGLAIVMLAPLVVTSVAGWFKQGSGDTFADLENYNPVEG